MDEVAKEVRYVGAMMEQVLSEVKTVHELVADMPTRGEFNELRKDVTELKQDMEVVKAAVTATNRDLKQHKRLPTHVAHSQA